ncbi:primosomal protein N' [Candidatus Sulfurimonas marisnigri]|uniref:Replication restart protein PriA n=1 Tax=Candidatus Sulfurimonas marisnigri TaxID=2740405 RepID=A0A7S7M0S4_9BACT|nr:primosomal protein N' [Candidatus Sulfurimonas marisnigri]QOY54967.1 primosomal protein N' [Candidatus Sulfurimonas marisnigri]
MHYYNISLLNSPLEPFTYQSLLNLHVGTKVSLKVRNRLVDGVIVSTCNEPEFKTSEILEVSDFKYSLEQMQLAKFISTYYFSSLGEAFGVMTPFSISQILLELDEETTLNITLSQKQQEALTFLKQHKTSLLFGDTGSGKTEIYMQYFYDVLKEKKRSIFLMPEISLTPQMGQRLEEHFGDLVVMWHSKLTPKQKKIALQKIYDGTAYIIAGPRSALFLPVEELGLIVVDEEHDDSYKSSSRPRYNARDIAIYMGKLYDVPVVLGSATPSLNSYTKFAHVRLKGGHFSSQKEFVYERSAEKLSPLIFDSLSESLKAKEQAIVFLPTRANFKYLICQDCGHTYECVFCSVGMSIHQKSRALKCHYCNYSQAIPQVCCECGGGSLTSSRLGTAEAVKVIGEEFSEARVEQFDRDVITTSNKLKKALKRFNDKESDILVGTQMLSKGHDYHGVTLAVVLGMDNMLNMGDYRAREKALSSLIQVSGRSGRKQNAKVLVQTFNEEFFKTYIGSYENFLEEEKEYRKELYPPYKKLCRILFSHKNGLKAQSEMNEMKEKLSKIQNIEIVGYGKCGVERVADKYRFEILLRSDKSTDIIKAIQACRVGLAEIDMDPIEFG